MRPRHIIHFKVMVDVGTELPISTAQVCHGLDVMLFDKLPHELDPWGSSSVLGGIGRMCTV